MADIDTMRPRSGRIIKENGEAINEADLMVVDGFYYGKKTVAVAGTAEALPSSATPIKSITIKALASNTGKVYVGGSGVSSANGLELSKGESISFNYNGNLNDIYIDADVSGEGVVYFALK